MPYIGKSPTNGVRNRFQYTATAGQTSFSGADDNALTLTYSDTLYMDVYQNGILLVPGDDYTATTGTSVVLVQSASLNDVIEIVVYDVFSVADTVSKANGGTFSSNIAIGGTLNVTGETTLATHLNMGDDDRIKLGADADMLIYHDGTHSSVQDNGTGDLRLKTNSSVVLLKGDSEILAQFDADGGCTFKHDSSTKLATKSDGVDITGELQCDSLDVDGASDFTGNLTVNNADIIVTGTGNRAINLTSSDAIGSMEIGGSTNAFIDLKQPSSDDFDMRVQGNSSGGTIAIASGTFYISGGTTLFGATHSGAVTLYHNGNSKLATNTGGVTVTGKMVATAPAFRATMSAGQTFSTATFTVVSFNQEVFDTNSNYDTSTYKFTPTVAGYYFFNFQIFAGASAGRCTAAIYKNGSSDKENYHLGDNTSGGIDYEVSAVVFCDGDDYIQAVFRHENGSDITSNSNVALTNFSGHLLMAT